MRSKFFLIIILAMLTVSVLRPVNSQGNLSFYSSRNSMPSNDYVDWSFFNLPPGSFVSSGSVINSANYTIPVTVSNPFNEHFTINQQSANLRGNFAPNDYVLEKGRINLEFARSVYTAGAQIQRDMYGDFTATIEAFDPNHASLGSFSLKGCSDGESNNSAIFLGVQDPLGRISSIQVDVTTTSQYGTEVIWDIGINRLDFQLGPIPSSVRLPAAVQIFGAIVLLGASLGLLAIYRRRKLTADN
jgi:hypothetical protein